MQQHLSILWNLLSTLNSYTSNMQRNMLILKGQETQEFNLICTSRYVVKHTFDLLDKIGLGAMEKLEQLVKRKCKANISTAFC